MSAPYKPPLVSLGQGDYRHDIFPEDVLQNFDPAARPPGAGVGRHPASADKAAMKGNEMTTAYRYQFREGIDPRDVEDTLLLAFLAAEGVFGEARVRMDGAYSIDRDARTATVDASTAVGQIVNAVFTAFAIKEFGRDGFTVRRPGAEVTR